jgi:cellulose synthase/poly-beta-1,6-N-acetylglucosamine synthase-like glycosyltransferase
LPRSGQSPLCASGILRPIYHRSEEELVVRLSVVIPFYNELRSLPTVIERLLAVDFAAIGVETDIVFVDDGSTDAGRYCSTRRRATMSG